MQPRKLKRAVIKEELVELTGNYIQAVLLNQFIYWTDRIKDYDQYVMEEKERMQQEGKTVEFPLSYGWIYKKADALSEETMLGLNEKTIRIHLKQLIKMGYIEQRRNPNYRWDRTYQYRVNLTKIIRDLNRIGFHLERYEMLSRTEKFSASNDNNSGAIPEITSEINTETTTDISKGNEEDLGKNDSFEKIRQLFLQLSNRKKLTANDTAAIQDVLQLGCSIEQILDWTKQCFASFNAKDNGDHIWSFKYVAIYIINQQEVLQNGKNPNNDERITGTDDPIYNKVKEQYGSDGGWIGDTECDF